MNDVPLSVHEQVNEAKMVALFEAVHQRAAPLFMESYLAHYAFQEAERQYHDNRTTFDTAAYIVCIRHLRACKLRHLRAKAAIDNDEEIREMLDRRESYI